MEEEEEDEEFFNHYKNDLERLSQRLRTEMVHGGEGREIPCA